ncbi:MAG: CoA pyrophosphatase [Candidatus Sumerlaeota bacterium]|nr:CoA pyrophosphatase [Candidatus Sumerlaeota bacterium]
MSRREGRFVARLSSSPSFDPCSIAEIAAVLQRQDLPLDPPADDDTPRAAVAIIVRQAPSSRIETLFIERAVCPGDPWSGHMAFPGGRRELRDSTLENAARRETREEVGLALTPAMRIGRLLDLRGSQRLIVTPYVYHGPAKPRLTLSPEVQSAVWIPLAHFADSARARPYRPSGEYPRKVWPSFAYERYTVWGLTYRMIASFMRLFGIELPD